MQRMERKNVPISIWALFSVNRLDAGQIAMEWVAFSSSRGNCKLNFETLDFLDRERLTKKAKKVDL